MNRRFVIYLLSFVLFTLSVQVQAAIPDSERVALIDLYNSTQGAGWTDKTGWLGDSGTECSWYGVTCSDNGSTITGLDLKANNLKGELPSSLTALTGLLSSDLRYNAVYSSDQTLIDFLDATGPVGSVLDTQTLDADGIVLSDVTDSGFSVSWNPVAYQQAGGYRLYLAEQIDTDSGSSLSDYVPAAEITDKGVTTTSLTGLVACRQYFVKVVSYTDPHPDNANEIESDGVGGPIVGTMPGFSGACNIIGSPQDDIFNITAGGDSVATYSVTIEVDDTGKRVYSIIYPGTSITVGSISGAGGVDSINISGGATVSLSSVNVTGNLNVNAVETIVADPNTNNTLIGTDAGSNWAVTGTNSGIVDSAVTFSSFQNLTGGSGNDTFTLTVGGSVTGIIDGGAGLDTNSVIAYNPNGVTITSGGGVITTSGTGQQLTQVGALSQIDNVILTVDVADFVVGDPIRLFSFAQDGFGGYDVAETTGVGSTIVSLVDKTGVADSGRSFDFGFDIVSGNDKGIFAINKKTGDIRLLKRLNYNRAKSHTLEIGIRINGYDFGAKPITINVIDVADGGCTLHPGAPFDPVWLFMLALAGIYPLRRTGNT